MTERGRWRASRPAVVLAVAALVLQAPPAGAVVEFPAAGLQEGLSGDAARAEALAPVRQVRAGLASGSLEEAIRAAADLDGVSVRAGRARAAPVPGGVPDRIAGPVGSLLGEIASATEVARRSLRADPAEVERLLDEAHDLIRDAAVLLPAPDGSRSSPAPVVRHANRLDQIRARLEAVVDRPSLYAAAADLAGAIDEALPALRAYAAGLPAATGTAEPCDVAERFPALCVSGTAAHEHTKDYALSIDLGGDDTYLNHAGAGDAAFGSSPELDLLPVSVVLDLSGDDLYREPATRSIADYYGVQGSGSRGGIGMLVDVEGDDRYLASTHAQGMGLAGVGVLADGAGTDRYEVVNREPGAYLEESTGRYFTNVGAARGQAHATAGMGLLLDRGFADDTYVLDGRPVPFELDGHVYAGGVYVEGQGVAFGGVAVFSDGGGADTLSIRGASDPELVPHRDRRTVEPGFVNASGMAYGVLGGQAVHLTGEGHTVRTLDADARFGYLAWTTGMGAANVGSYAALDDESGNDTYTASAARRTIRKLTIDEENATQDHDHVVVASIAGGEIQTWTFAMGWAGLESVAVLHDGEGDDSYSVTTLTHAEAEARNELPTLPADPGTPSAMASADAGVAAISGQGFAQEDSAGFLLDDGGNDVYEARTISRALARATASHPEASTVAGAFSGATQNMAQASSVSSSYAELRDRGGRDAYVLESISDAQADPPSMEVSSDELNSWGWAFTFGLGDARFADLGGTDSFTMKPYLPACVGTRGGEGVWVDCNPFEGGVGLNHEG